MYIFLIAATISIFEAYIHLFVIKTREDPDLFLIHFSMHVEIFELLNVEYLVQV
jgi:hypothetical protein